jgi:hypothetical protein
MDNRSRILSSLINNAAAFAALFVLFFFTRTVVRGNALS